MGGVFCNTMGTGHPQKLPLFLLTAPPFIHLDCFGSWRVSEMSVREISVKVHHITTQRDVFFFSRMGGHPTKLTNFTEKILTVHYLE